MSGTYLASLKRIIKRMRNTFERILTSKIVMSGTDNLIEYNGSRLRECKITVKGNHNVVEFGDNCDLKGLSIFIVGDCNKITLGKGVTVNASKNKPTVMNAINGTNVLVGDYALFSNNIEIHTSDYHSIFDETGKRINLNADIIIGRHVWIGLGAKILKGSIICEDSVVGAGCVIANRFDEPNVIIAGVPGKIIKKNINWDIQS